MGHGEQRADLQQDLIATPKPLTVAQVKSQSHVAFTYAIRKINARFSNEAAKLSIGECKSRLYPSAEFPLSIRAA